MFGSKQEKIKKLVSKNKWEVIKKKYANSDAEARLFLAQACADSKNPESCNVLLNLIKDEDDKVQLAAVKSVGIVADDHATAYLQWLLTKLPESKKETIDAIHKSIANIRLK